MGHIFLVGDGTKIVIQLKEDCKNFSDEEEIKGPFIDLILHNNSFKY